MRAYKVVEEKRDRQLGATFTNTIRYVADRRLANRYAKEYKEVMKDKSYKYIVVPIEIE